MAAPYTWVMNRQDGLSDLKGGKEKGDYIVSEIDLDFLEENLAAEQLCPVQIINVHKKVS